MFSTIPELKNFQAKSLIFFFAERFHCCLGLLFTARTSIPDGPVALHHQHGSVTANCTLRMALFTLCFLFSSTPGLIIATTLYKPRQKYPTVLIFGHESVSAFIKFLFNAVFSSKKFSHLEHYSFFRLNTSAPSQWPFKCGRKSSILIETEKFSCLLLPRSQSYHRDARGNGMGRGEQMR